MQVSIPEFIGGGILIILVNVGIWIFAWGRTVGKVMEAVDTLKRELQEHKDDKRCHDQATQMKLIKAVSSLTAKVEMICGSSD